MSFSRVQHDISISWLLRMKHVSRNGWKDALNPFSHSSLFPSSLIGLTSLSCHRFNVVFLSCILYVSLLVSWYFLSWVSWISWETYHQNQERKDYFPSFSSLCIFSSFPSQLASSYIECLSLQSLVSQLDSLDSTCFLTFTFSCVSYLFDRNFRKNTTCTTPSRKGLFQGKVIEIRCWIHKNWGNGSPLTRRLTHRSCCWKNNKNRYKKNREKEDYRNVSDEIIQNWQQRRLRRLYKSPLTCTFSWYLKHNTQITRRPKKNLRKLSRSESPDWRGDRENSGLQGDIESPGGDEDSCPPDTKVWFCPVIPIE